MNQNYIKLKKLLRELFQLDQPDLDFGLYRVMHAKSDEVNQFLDKDLLPQVESAFRQYKTADKADLEKELAKAIDQATTLGADPESLPKVKELRVKLANDSVNVGQLENDVYEHLFSFFRRYYSEGDFLAKRVYKPGVYAIPYEGEEVTLHWANKDQYYIKTSEYLRDYTFRLHPSDDKNPMRVHFKLADVAEGEHGNVKATEDKDRVFILVNSTNTTEFIAEDAGPQGPELNINFEYRPATLTDWPNEVRSGKSKPPSQKDLISIAVKRLLSVTDANLKSWIEALAKRHVTVAEEEADYSRIEAHLRRYTARNTFDYFIHKDLDGFLRRELDFYIKNEVMHLDDVENESAQRVEQYLSKIKVIRKIAGKIIDFLAQLEDFQKKLWLKKKFVVETHYCITLSTIPEEFYPEIAANKAQREEWVKLFAIDELKSTGSSLLEAGKPGYSVPLKTDFLKAHPTLVLDTRHFDVNFTAKLLGSIGDIDEQTDGLLIHSDNFQALKLINKRHANTIDCVYIDPPYNANSSEILYKNTFKHSSWLSLIDNRFDASRELIKKSFVYVVAIDEVEQECLGRLLYMHFPETCRNCIVVNHNPSGQQGDNFSFTHEYAYFVHPQPGRYITEQTRNDSDEWDERNFRDVTGDDSLRKSGKNCFYPIFVKNGEIKGFGDVCPPDFHPKMNEDAGNGTLAIYPIDPNGIERKWRFARDTVEAIKDELKPHALDRRGLIDIKRIKKRFNYKSNWVDARYSANNHGTQLLNHIIPRAPASYPKSLYTVRDCIHAALNGNNLGIILDYFAGSGTTGHAVINLNREDDGKRKYILSEIGMHFDTVILPRIKKVTFSPEWKDGKPKRLATAEEAERSPRIVKVIRLESYEDTLNNLEVRRTQKQQLLLDDNGAKGADGLNEQYLLRYMLNVETRGSQSLLNIQDFNDPTAYKLKVKRPGSDESSEVNIDLLETFNWLTGITVKHIAAPQTFSAKFERDAEKRLKLKDRLNDVEGPYWFRTVTGTTPDGRKTLIIWRKLSNKPEEDNLVLDEWFTKQGYSEKDSRFDTIWVNGGNNLENLKAADDRWKVRLIEEDFHRLMFEMDK